MKQYVGIFLLLVLIGGCTFIQEPPAEGTPERIAPNVSEFVPTAVVPDMEAPHPTGEPPPPSSGPQLPSLVDFIPRSCTDTAVRFTASPLELEDLDYIIPMGALTGTHITPVDHQYYMPLPWENDPSAHNVHAPANGTITRIERLNFPGDPSAGDRGASDYRMYIEYSCNVYSIFIHLSTLSERIRQTVGALQPGESREIRIPVEAGEVIGTIQGSPQRNVFGLDFSVHDERVVLPGFVVPEHYEGEPWKIHTVDPFDYFNEPLRDELLAKDLRSESPRGGKIDYDVDGKLAGNWFREGSAQYTDTRRDRYWEDHMAIVYNHIDPSYIVVSIGDLPGEMRQWGVHGNGPDPGQVDPSTGKVKYELVMFDYYAGDSNEFWDRIHYAQHLKVRENERGEPYGVLLVEMQDNRTLKMEVFEGRSPAQVDSFTANARIYTR